MCDLVNSLLDNGVERVSFERLDGAQTAIAVEVRGRRLATKYAPDRTDNEVLSHIKEWISEIPVAGVNGR